MPNVYFSFISKADSQREGKRKIACWQVPSPNGSSGQSWAYLEPAASSGSSYVGTGSQALGPSSAVFLGYRQGAGLEVQQVGDEQDTQIRNVGEPSYGVIHYNTTPVL